jgi:hypothetical protein
LYLGNIDAAEASFRESLKAYPDQPDTRRMMRRENMERAVESTAGMRKTSRSGESE